MMGYLRIACDWVLIILSSYILYRAIDRMVMARFASLANYIIGVTVVFCCLPVLLDYLFGRPRYETIYWYQPFVTPIENNDVSCIYDVLIAVSLVALHFYSNGRARNSDGRPLAWSSGIVSIRPLSYFIIIAPVIYIIGVGIYPFYMRYGDAGSRGLPDTASTIVNALLLLSVIAFCTLFFGKQSQQNKVCRAVILLFYSFLMAWISGKRFFIALLLLLYLFFFLNCRISIRSRESLKRRLPVILLALIGFSAFYLVGVRPLSDVSASSVYEMLRVDFGRDDVTKYVIYHEFFLGDHILDYPGQTFLSTFLIWIPRQIWPLKPFQHYQYLTSSILGLPIAMLPAGTTPSWWDMCIANFSLWGCIVSVVGLICIISLADRARTISTRATALVLIVALLTQSVDAYLSLVILLIILSIANIFLNRKKSFRKEAARSLSSLGNRAGGGASYAS